MRREERDCCSDPASYQFHLGYGYEPETGYGAESYYECVCGERIGGEDYASLDVPLTYRDLAIGMARAQASQYTTRKENA